MKKFAALLIALIMLLSVAAMAEETTEPLYTAENGTAVTLTMKGEYTIDATKTDSGETLLWKISREGVADVYIIITPLEEIVGLNDLSDEEIDEILDKCAEDYGDSVTASVEVTPSGNKYINYFWDENGSQMEERWTYFEGFELNCFQASLDEALTEEDTAFLTEVQEGLWVAFPETAE